MKTKINIAILIVVASISLAACVEEEIKPGPIQGSTIPGSTKITFDQGSSHTPVK